MKIRIFKKMENGVFAIRIHTEDWSENDRGLMKKYGEPSINLGGSSDSSSSSSSSDEPEFQFDDVYVRIMTESPFVRRFDSRDYGSANSARETGNLWSSVVESRIADAVAELRAKDEFFNTEEITEY